MTIVRYEPWTVMNRLHREIDQIFGDSFATPAASGGTAVPNPGGTNPGNTPGAEK